MTSFFERLEKRAREVDSLLCIGIDPHPADLPEQTVQALREFSLKLIEQTAHLAAAFKPNAAFYERFGPEGWQVLREVIEAVPDGIPVLLDAKRGDIASTAEAYANSAFEKLGADAITLSPYLGHDSLEPFIRKEENGVFLLCKTSNPGAGDLQDLELKDTGGIRLYEKVALLAEEWNTFNNIGLVVGATQPASLAAVRKAAPSLWILAPGVGAQGGSLESAMRAGLRADGFGMLVPVSRAIARSEDPAQAAEVLRQQINEERKAFLEWSESRDEGEPLISERLAEGLLEAGCVRFGTFTLKSGLQSPIYLDLRRLISHPDLLAEVAKAYQAVLADLTYDRLAGLPYAAIPIATAVSLLNGKPMIYPRKEVKAYGTKAEIEGDYHQGECALVIDDLATTGGSKFEAIDKLLAAGLVVRDVVVLIDRESGAAESLYQAGYRLHAVTTITKLLDYWESKGRIPAEQISAVRHFLAEQ